jgi:pyridoxamine 5'-phosphate oxidase
MDQAPLIAPAADPITLFEEWFATAYAQEPMAEAVSLATADASGRPSVRMVLLKGVSAEGFVFYTNTTSRKGRDIAANPQGALCFHWKTLGRQVRIEGRFGPVTAAEADAYFASRPRESQLGAWASLQSEVLPDRTTLSERYRAAEARYRGGPVPRPPHWSGYRLAPTMIEFWHDVPSRLHDRLVYERDAGVWRTRRLYP